MEFVLSTKEKVSREDGTKLLTLLSDLLRDKGYNILYEEMNEIDNSNLPMGDMSIQEETYFQTKIRRMLPSTHPKIKDCSKEVCIFED